MRESVSAATINAFYDALASRDPARLAECLADDVEWHMAGPVEVFAFCGYRRGKAAVADYIARLVPSVFTIKRMEKEETVIDGESCAMFSRIAALHKETGRIVVYQSALFVVFCDGKVVSAQGVADTFGAAEQVMGHHIDPFGEPARPVFKDVIAL